MLQFRTHTGEIVTGQRLTDACKQVADFLRDNARSMRAETNGKYASHVTEADKDRYLAEKLEYADRVERGETLHNFSTWQRVNTALTGECVGLLSC